MPAWLRTVQFGRLARKAAPSSKVRFPAMIWCGMAGGAIATMTPSISW